MSNNDERIKRTDEDRTNRTKDETRQPRAQETSPSRDDRQLTEDERLEMFQLQSFREVLPDLPPIPGYHVCWLTTTNPRDTIHYRMRLGYTPVTRDDVPGWGHTVLKTGEYAGMIGVNEMVAFKLPLSLYNKYMREAHHDAPRREDEKLLSTVDFIKEEANKARARVEEEEGTRELRRHVPAPESFEGQA